jgi:hypothetical protein
LTPRQTFPLIPAANLSESPEPPLMWFGMMAFCWRTVTSRVGDKGWANVIAWPVGRFVMRPLLGTVRISRRRWTRQFLWAGAVALLITWIQAAQLVSA